MAHCRTRGSDSHAGQGHHQVRRQQPRRHWLIRPWSCGATQAMPPARSWETLCPAQVPVWPGQPLVLAASHALGDLSSPLSISTLLPDSELGAQQTMLHCREPQSKLRRGRAEGLMYTIGERVVSLNDAGTVSAGPSRQAEGERDSAPGVVSATRKCRRAQQGKSLKPCDMPVSRASLFYSSTFPAHAGFPSTREGSLILTSMCFKRF